MNKKNLAMLLVLVMVVSLLPVTAFAADECAHENSTLVRSTAPDCHFTGIELRNCTDCGMNFTVELPATGEHNMVDGTCTVCGMWEETEETQPEETEPAATECEHDYVVVKEEGSCVEYVYAWYECSKCGAEKNGETNYYGAHDYVDGVCTVCAAADPDYVAPTEPAETEPCAHEETWDPFGDGVLYCKKCNTLVGVIEEEPECTHENTYYDIVEANCAEEGVSKVICKDCGETVSEEVLPKTEDHYYNEGVCLRCGAAEPAPCTHENTRYDIIEANCAEEGVSKVICKDCGETVSEEVLPKTEDHYYNDGVCLRCGAAEPAPCTHENTRYDIIEANCAEEGVSKVICKDCGETVSEEVLPKTEDHYYQDGVCLRCGAEEACEHDYVVVKELAPTCVEAGYVWYECSKCGAELNHEVGEPDADAHDYVVVRELDPTCVEAGYAWYECSLCGAELNHEVGEIDPYAHNYVVVKELAPTCVEAGYVWYECTLCGAELNHEQGEPTGEHDYMVVKELDPTCVEAGYAWYECSVCGAELNHEVGEPTGEHDYVVVKELAPTCNEAGYVWYECSVCGAELNHEQGEATGEHTYEEGVCTVCGAEDPDYVPEETEPEETVPATPVKPARPNVGSIIDSIKDAIGKWFGGNDTETEPVEPTEPEVTEPEATEPEETKPCFGSWLSKWFSWIG